MCIIRKKANFHYLKLYFLPILFFTICTNTGYSQCSTIASDNFSSGGSSGGSGWANNWTLSNASVVSGEVFMDGNSFGTASRTVNLSSQSSASISFTFRCSDSSSGFESDDFVRVRVSTDGGTTFTDYWYQSGADICPDGNDNETYNETVVIPGGSANTVIRLESGTNSSSEDVFWDNIVVGKPAPSVEVAAIEATCSNGVANNDALLQFPNVLVGDRFHYSIGNTFNDNSGADTYTNATNFNSTNLPVQVANGLPNPTGSQDYTVRVYNGANDCFTDVTVTLDEQECGCYEGCLLQPGEALITCGSFSPDNNSVAIGQRLDEKVLGIMDINDPVGNGASTGSNWAGPSSTGFGPSTMWDAQQLGEIYGLATRPNLATGCHDYYVTQWGQLPGGLFDGGSIYQGDLATSCNGGAIFKVDGRTGAVSNLACLPSTYGVLPAQVFNEIDRFYIGTYNTYTGLGQITYNKDCDVFYVSNFENGLIYILDANGTTLGTYDFGMQGLPALVTNEGAVPTYLSSYVNASNQIADNTSDALTPWQRRVFGVGYNPNDGKLYFGTIRRSNPTSTTDYGTRGVNQYVFSVSIDANSCLPVASSTATEVIVTNGDRSPVSDIVFDINNNMLMSQMNLLSISNKGAHHADGLLYSGGTGSWTQDEVYETSTYENGGGSAGGTDFGYNNWGTSPDIAAGNCPEESVVFTVDAALGINPPAIYGLEIQPFTGATPTNSYVIDGDGNLNDRHKYVFGDVEIIAPVCNLTNLNLQCISATSTTVTFCVKPDTLMDIINYSVSTSQGTLDKTTGNACAKDTFVLTTYTDLNTIDVTVDIGGCAGMKPCSMTTTLSGCVLSCTNPILTSLTNQTICEGGSFTSTNITTSVSNSVTVSYQWYNDNGANNPTTNIISGQTTATLTALPTAVGVYQYKIVATDASDASCSDEETVTLTILENPTVTATATDPTCDGGNEDSGTITLAGFTTEKYDINIGSSYIGTADYNSATNIPSTGIIVSNLANPTGSQDYTIRIFNSDDCYVDRTVTINEVSCCPSNNCLPINVTIIKGSD